MNQSWVYILANASASVLYVGVTTNLRERVDEHALGRGSRFTSKYHVTRLVYYETFSNVRLAIAREKEIKGWRRSKKDALIRRYNPELANLRRRL